MSYLKIKKKNPCFHNTKINECGFLWLGKIMTATKAWFEKKKKLLLKTQYMWVLLYLQYKKRGFFECKNLNKIQLLNKLFEEELKLVQKCFFMNDFSRSLTSPIDKLWRRCCGLSGTSRKRKHQRHRSVDWLMEERVPLKDKGPSQRQVCRN